MYIGCSLLEGPLLRVSLSLTLFSGHEYDSGEVLLWFFLNVSLINHMSI